jgi:hypothetical protein
MVADQWARWQLSARGAICCILLGCCVGAFADNVKDKDDDADATPPSAAPALNAEQQTAGGIVVAHPLNVQAPQHLDALGLVLDPVSLVTDAGEMTAAAAAEQAATAELSRLRGLYGGGGASLKTLEAAQAEQAKAHAESESATLRYGLHWGPVAALPAPERQTLLEAAMSGHALLVRADVPGRHILGTLPLGALLSVDGIEVPGRVLGPLRQSSEVQSAALLILVRNAPAGLGPGARVPITLSAAPRVGSLLPHGAVFYDENGAFVYKRVNAQSGDHKTRYSPVKVTLLLAYRDGWLVDGVDNDDEIVVQGAGTLWSLQGLGAIAVDDDQD